VAQHSAVGLHKADLPEEEKGWAIHTCALLPKKRKNIFHVIHCLETVKQKSSCMSVIHFPGLQASRSHSLVNAFYVPRLLLGCCCQDYISCKLDNSIKQGSIHSRHL